jgi:hypothetical protein
MDASCQTVGSIWATPGEARTKWPLGTMYEAFFSGIAGAATEVGTAISDMTLRMIELAVMDLM